MGLLASTVFVGPAAHAVTTDLYVATTGSDANDCSQQAPCATIGQAISVAPDTATIHVGPGTFAEDISPGSKTIIVVGNGETGSDATTIAPTGSGAIAVDTGGMLTLDSVRVTPVMVGADVTGGELDTEHVTFEDAPCAVYASGGTVTLTDTTIEQNGSSRTGCAPVTPQSTAVSVAGASVALLRTSITNTQGLGVVVGSGTFSAADSTFSDASDFDTNSQPAVAVSGGSATIERSLFDDDELDLQSSGGLTTISDTTFHSAGTSVYTSSGAGPTVLRSTFNFAPVYGPVKLAGSMLFADRRSSACNTDAPQPTDLGYNLSADSTCGFTRSTSKNSVANLDLDSDPADHGGPTQTLAVRSPSPAIGAIPLGARTSDNTAVLCGRGAVDQRGLARPQGPACDVGAFEVGASATTLRSTRHTAAPGSTVSLIATVTPHTGTFSGPDPVQGTVTFTFGKTTLCTKSVSAAATATCATKKLPPGRDKITARFASSSPYLNSSASSSPVIATVPRVTSPAHARITVGTRKAIAIHASGKPAPLITIASGRLPKGVHFTRGHGTATISGRPAPGTAKRYVLHLHATNVRSTAAQTFTLTVVRG